MSKYELMEMIKKQNIETGYLDMSSEERLEQCKLINSSIKETSNEESEKNFKIYLRVRRGQ